MSRTTLIHYVAACHTCGASVAARNAMGWAHNHLRHHPGHECDVQLGYFVSDRPLPAKIPPHPKGEA